MSLNRRQVNRLWFGEKNEVEDFERMEPLRPWEEKVPLSWVKDRGKRLPPLPLCMLLVGAICWLLLALAVSLIPFVVNWDRNTSIWVYQTEKTVYTASDTIIIGTWIFVHMCSALAAWFVWMDGAFTNQMRRLVPFFVLLGVEVVIPDAIFAVPSNIFGAIWLVVVFGVGLLAAIFLGREVSYSAILVVPLLCWLLYGAIVLMGVQFVQSDIVGTSS